MDFFFTKKHPVLFNKKQYEQLLKLVYLGNWVANANRTDDILKAYDEVEELILSHAKDFGLKKLVDDEAAYGKNFYPSRYLEEETDIRQLIDDYDEETFWDELIDRLGERDFYRKYSKEEIKSMNREERFSNLYECIDAWSDKINKFGIEKLEIKEDK